MVPETCSTIFSIAKISERGRNLPMQSVVSVIIKTALEMSRRRRPAAKLFARSLLAISRYLFRVGGI